MNRTKKNLLHLHSDITRYAEAKTREYGMPRCDLEDIISEAYLKAQRKLTRHTERTNRKELFKAIAWCAVMNELERRNRIAALHDKYDLRLDAEKPTVEDDESDEAVDNDGLAVGDEGAGAEAVRSFDEEGETPPWAVSFRAQYNRERGLPRKVIDRLKRTWQYEKARLELGLEEEVFYKILKKLRMRFDQCFRAYHACLAEKAMRSA